MAAISIAQGQGGSEAQQRLALLALGGIGRTTDLSSYEDVQPAITGDHSELDAHLPAHETSLRCSYTAVQHCSHVRGQLLHN